MVTEGSTSPFSVFIAGYAIVALILFCGGKQTTPTFTASFKKIALFKFVSVLKPFYLIKVNLKKISNHRLLLLA